MELDIEIFYHSDETATKKDTGVPYSVLECETRIMTFYEIACIAPYEDEVSKEWFCKIVSGGETFITVKPFEDIKKMISIIKKTLQ